MLGEAGRKAWARPYCRLRITACRRITYDLDMATYDVLRRDNETVSRVLVVFRLPKAGEKVRLLKGGTLLAGCGAWTSLEGYPPSLNKFSQVVKLPVANTVDRRGLERMLAMHGGRWSTPVPVIDPWEAT